MIQVNPEIICNIIAKTREFHAQEGVVFPMENEGSDGDWARQVLAAHSDDSSASEVHNIVEDLEPDQQVQLVAVMWLGRGDFDDTEWDAAVEQAGDSWNKRTADYLLGTPLVADYLEEGLSLLGYSCD